MILSWTEKLANAYNVLCLEEDSGILPIAHSRQNAQITVSLNLDGTIPPLGFVEKVDKSDAPTVIPVTAASGSRTSPNYPHPFEDKLMYLAGDYHMYGTGKYTDRKFYDMYMEGLKKWCDFDPDNKVIKAVYEYLSKGTLVKDLVDAGVLNVDSETGKLSDDKIATTPQTDALVRFIVDGKKAWKNTEMFESFERFNASLSDVKQLCYATGEELSATYTHPKYIRNPGDSAKLFSTNDTSGFSYRGRFSDKTQATSISYDYSQRMHNALKCLIANQGINVDGLCVLVWEDSLIEVPDATQKCVFEDDDDDFNDENEQTATTGKINRDLTRKSLMGTQNKYGPTSQTMLMMFDSATPGRLSITEYAELATSDYISNLAKWHDDTSWICYGKRRSFSVYEIADCVFGIFDGTGKRHRKLILQQLLPYIVGGGRIPRDIVNQLFIRSCRYNSFGKEENDWKKTINCACGMIRKRIIETKGECTMSLDKESHSRDYLYGRLLAVADVAEASTYDKEDSRPTNAKRFFEAFSNHPYQTWDVIYKSLRPYLDRMSRGGSIYYERMINEITSMFEHNEFKNNSPLSPEFLHAYSCQVNELYAKKTNDNKEDK